jgi:predicted XRE-type DNA-binding protein
MSKARSVFHDLFDAEEAVDLEIRSVLLVGLQEWLKREGGIQAEAAKKLGVTQARISEIRNGKISRFTVDKLIALAVRAGLHPHMELAA